MPREDTTEDSLLAVSWQSVWQGFERLASMPMISLVAVVIDGDGDPSAFIHELAARENRAHWQANPIRAVDGRPDEYQAAVASHQLFAFGEPETWEAFRVAAMRAGVLAKAVSERLLPASVRDRRSDLDRWAWALFEIGWRELDATPFRAQRWAHDGGGVVQLELARRAGLYRGWYYSEIGDAVSASIDVVDVLRTMERVGRGSAAASPAKGDDADVQLAPVMASDHDGTAAASPARDNDADAQPTRDDGEDWAPYDEIKTLYSVSSGQLTKWAGKNPKIRRGATPADCEKWSKPSLRFVYDKRLIYEATERDPDAE